MMFQHIRKLWDSRIRNALLPSYFLIALCQNRQENRFPLTFDSDDTDICHNQCAMGLSARIRASIAAAPVASHASMSPSCAANMHYVRFIGRRCSVWLGRSGGTDGFKPLLIPLRTVWIAGLRRGPVKRIADAYQAAVKIDAEPPQ